MAVYKASGAAFYFEATVTLIKCYSEKIVAVANGNKL